MLSVLRGALTQLFSVALRPAASQAAYFILGLGGIKVSTSGEGMVRFVEGKPVANDGLATFLYNLRFMTSRRAALICKVARFALRYGLFWPAGQPVLHGRMATTANALAVRRLRGWRECRRRSESFLQPYSCGGGLE